MPGIGGILVSIQVRVVDQREATEERVAEMISIRDSVLRIRFQLAVLLAVEE